MGVAHIDWSTKLNIFYVGTGLDYVSDEGNSRFVAICRISLSICGPLNKDDASGVDSAPNGVTTPTSEWLNSVLLRKVVQWSEEGGRKGRGGAAVSASRHESLVSLSSYSSLYSHLRDKYGPSLIQVNITTIF